MKVTRLARPALLFVASLSAIVILPGCNDDGPVEEIIDEVDDDGPIEEVTEEIE